jgi:alkanesulfonate monooxygenase SsuD/methylene tetrahydromethanopterin reductase-like flavin-dependent oxidoreductase (luciferase family)
MAQVNRATEGKPFRETFATTQVFGSPKQCVERIRQIRSTVDAAEFVGVFKYGGMPLEEAERSLRLFAAEVLAEVHRMGGETSDAAAAAGR